MELDNVLHSDVQDSPLVASMTNHYSNQFTNSTQEMNHQLDAKSNDQANEVNKDYKENLSTGSKITEIMQFLAENSKSVPKVIKKALGPLQLGADSLVYAFDEKESHPNQPIGTTVAVGGLQGASVSAFGTAGMAAGVAVGFKAAESLTNFMPQPAGALAKVIIFSAAGASGLAGSYLASTAYEEIKINDKGSVHDNVGNFARDNSSSFASWAKDVSKSITSIFTSRDTQATNCNSNAVVGCVSDGSLQNYRHSDHEIEHGGGGHASHSHINDCTKDNSCGNKTHEACKDGDKGCKIGGGLSHDLSRDNDSEHDINHDSSHDADTSDHDSSHDIDHDVDNDNGNDD